VTRSRIVTGYLDLLLSRQVICSWRDVCDGQRFVVVGTDRKPHTWTASQVCAFFAGYCAGRDSERAQR
jgi:hypothetical protein